VALRGAHEQGNGQSLEDIAVQSGGRDGHRAIARLGRPGRRPGLAMAVAGPAAGTDAARTGLSAAGPAAGAGAAGLAQASAIAMANAPVTANTDRLGRLAIAEFMRTTNPARRSNR